MILVDTSAWIDLLRGSEGPAHRSLRALLEAERELACAGPIAMELLAGARGPAELRRIEAVLAACRMLSIGGARGWEDAAAVYRACRIGGATPRQLVDCLIAAIAIREAIPVLSADRDFALIAEHTRLELAV